MIFLKFTLLIILNLMQYLPLSDNFPALILYCHGIWKYKYMFNASILVIIC